MNNVVMIGRLTRDPELKYAAGSGKAVCKFTIAVSRPFSKDNKADFFPVVVFGKPAENTANYTGKGSLVGVQGRLQNNNYETNTGEKRYSTEIVADRVEFLDRKKENNDSIDGFQAIEDDDDVPF